MTDAPQAATKPSLDLAEIRYVKRIEIGASEDGQPRAPEEIERATELLNRCLNDTPRGQILEIEKVIGTHKAGEMEFVSQRLVYHVGWRRKPHWLDAPE